VATADDNAAMGSLAIRMITFDCADARTLGRFWAEALGWNVYWDEDPEVLVAPAFPLPPGAEPGLLFIPVPEPKRAKNRMHLDLGAEDGTRDQHVERLVGLGARVIDDRREPDGTGWVVLADPEGNELCVARGRAEQSTPATRVIGLTVE
jgi:predicted enzyme related to lactoylglutathione lyase